MQFTLDHLVIAVRDLERATADYTFLLGRRPSWHGVHPKYGTRNTLFRVDNTYVELLAVEKKRGRWAGELARFLEKSEGLYALALGTSDIKSDVKTLRGREMPVEDARDGEGIEATTGQRRYWRNARMPAKASHGVPVFFIEHRSPPESLPPAPIATEGGAHVRRLDHIVILSPDLEASKRLWSEKFDARLALDRTFPSRQARILFFRLGDITVEISGGATQTEEGMNKPDRLWGVAWGVDDVRAACARLRAAGVAVSDPRPGAKPGTIVATVKGEHTHGVAMLLIEHTPESFESGSRLPHSGAYDNAAERRAFRATALDHVALAVSDVDEAARTWLSTLGIAADERLDSSATRLRVASLPEGAAKIVLAQPAWREHVLNDWIAERGPGMYAVAVEVDDIDAAVKDLRSKGVQVSDPEYGAWPGTRVARIDRGSAHGVSIQLVQRLPEVM